MIRAGDTTGVFQIESRAQMQMLVRSRPENLNDIFIQVAIVRPGPITGGAVHPYLDRRKKLRADPDYEVPYAHPLLKEVLEDTLGSIVFQDQVIEVARVLADFTPSEGEGLRRAMSRKRSHEALGRLPPAVHRRGGAERGLRRGRRERLRADHRLFGLRFSEGARGGVRACSPTRPPGCAATTGRSCCAG